MVKPNSTGHQDMANGVTPTQVMTESAVSTAFMLILAILLYALRRLYACLSTFRIQRVPREHHTYTSSVAVPIQGAAPPYNNHQYPMVSNDVSVPSAILTAMELGPQKV